MLLSEVSNIKHILYRILKDAKTIDFENIEYDLGGVENLITNVNAVQAEFMSNNAFQNQGSLSFVIFTTQNCVMNLISEKN